MDTRDRLIGSMEWPPLGLGLGTMSFVGEGAWGPVRDRREAIGLMRHAIERGVRLIDTADAYGPESVEMLIGDALVPDADGLIVATKGGMTRPSATVWVPDGRPDRLRLACESSLRRLRTETIGLYLLHHPDPRVPIEESFGALADLQQAGKIRRIGVSNVNLAQYRRCRATAVVSAVQNRFNLVDRTSSAVVDECLVDGAVFMAWSPLAGARSSPVVASIAVRHQVAPEVVALAWLAARSPTVVPVPGTTSFPHLEANLSSAAVVLRPDEIDGLESVTSPPGWIRRRASMIKARVVQPLHHAAGQSTRVRRPR